VAAHWVCHARVRAVPDGQLARAWVRDGWGDAPTHGVRMHVKHAGRCRAGEACVCVCVCVCMHVCTRFAPMRTPATHHTLARSFPLSICTCTPPMRACMQAARALRASPSRAAPTARSVCRGGWGRCPPAGSKARCVACCVLLRLLPCPCALVPPGQARTPLSHWLLFARLVNFISGCPLLSSANPRFVLYRAAAASGCAKAASHPNKKPKSKPPPPPAPVIHRTCSGSGKWRARAVMQLRRGRHPLPQFIAGTGHRGTHRTCLSPAAQGLRGPMSHCMKHTNWLPDQLAACPATHLYVTYLQRRTGSTRWGGVRSGPSGTGVRVLAGGQRTCTSTRCGMHMTKP